MLNQVSSPKIPIPSICNLSLCCFVLGLLFAALPVEAARKKAPPSKFQELVTAIKPGEWLELPGTISEVFVNKEETQGNGEVIGAKAVIVAWSGAAWDANCGYFMGGGHTDYGGNEVYSYCWAGQEPLQWRVLMPPSKSDPDDHNTCPHPINGPRAYHIYDGVTYVPDNNSIMLWGVSGYCQTAILGNDEVAELKLGAEPTWKLHPTGVIDSAAHTAYNPKNKLVYVWQGKRQVYIVDPKTMETKPSGQATADYGASVNLVYDGQRDVLWANTGLGLFQFSLDARGEVTGFSKIVANNELPPGLSSTDGIALRKGQLYFWSGEKNVIKFDPETKKWSTSSSTQGPTRASVNGVFSKWHYLEEFDVFVGVSHFQQGMWVWKPSEGEGRADTRDISVCQTKSKDCGHYVILLDALKQAKHKSSLKLTKGYYTDQAVLAQDNLQVIGQDGVVVEGIAAGKATFVAAGSNITFKNLEVTLPSGFGDANDACFRGERPNLTLTGIYCHDMQMGVIGGAGTLTIENSKFENSGLNGTANLGHMVYACSNGECPDGSLVIKNSLFLRMGINRPGHGIKSRAPHNLIEDVVIASIDSTSGRAMDFSQGGETLIKNVVMQFGPKSENEDFIAIALEDKKYPMYSNTSTHIENVIAICDRPTPCDFIRYLGPVPKLKNVVLVGAFKFYDDLYPIPKDEIIHFKTRAEAGLKDYPYVPSKWFEIKK